MDKFLKDLARRLTEALARRQAPADAEPEFVRSKPRASARGGLFRASLAAVGLVLALGLALRAMRDDPRTIAVTQQNPNIEIGLVGKSSILYRVHDRRSDLTGFIQLRDDETLTGGIEIWLCDDSVDRLLPDWLPRYARATHWVCVVAGTDQGKRRHASFTTEAALDEVYAFYEAAMENVPFTGSASSQTRSSVWNGDQYWTNVDTGQTLSIKYFSDRVADRPMVTMTFTEGKAG